jgi:hypothetical protein
MIAESISPQTLSPILTEAEAIHYLRLDVEGPKNPRGTLKYYRDHKLLRAARIGRKLRYPIAELDALVARLIGRSTEREGASR